jgi:hypothetical protein
MDPHDASFWFVGDNRLNIRRRIDSDSTFGNERSKKIAKQNAIFHQSVFTGSGEVR